MQSVLNMLNTAASQLDRRYDSSGLKAARAYASEVAGSLAKPAASAERIHISGKVALLRRLEKAQASGNRVNHAFSSMLEQKNASLASTFGTLSFANESQSQHGIYHSKNRSTATMIRRPTGGIFSQGTYEQMSNQPSQLPAGGIFKLPRDAPEIIKIMQTDKSDTILPMLSGTGKGIRITPKLRGKRRFDQTEEAPMNSRPSNQRDVLAKFVN